MKVAFWIGYPTLVLAILWLWFILPIIRRARENKIPAKTLIVRAVIFGAVIVGVVTHAFLVFHTVDTVQDSVERVDRLQCLAIVFWSILLFGCLWGFILWNGLKEQFNRNPGFTLRLLFIAFVMILGPIWGNFLVLLIPPIKMPPELYVVGVVIAFALTWVGVRKIHNRLHRGQPEKQIPII